MAVWWAKWNKPSIFNCVYIMCYRKSWPPSVNITESIGSWTAVLIYCSAGPKKPHLGARYVSLDLASQRKSPNWETAVEQNHTLPTLTKFKLYHHLPPHQLYCKYHLELIFTGFFVSPGRISKDPVFEAFPPTTLEILQSVSF